MKFLVAVILTALLAFAGGLFFPWWIIAVTSFVVGLLIHQRAFKAFLAGFLGLFLLWGIHAFYIDNKNNHLLAVKVAQILNIGSWSLPLIALTALVGALVSAFAAMTGSLLRKPV